jgi:hypothetical protein
MHNNAGKKNHTEFVGKNENSRVSPSKPTITLNTLIKRQKLAQKF